MKNRVLPRWLLAGLAFLLAVSGVGKAYGQFKPTDISGCVWWISPQGDPYATTSVNPGGCFLDTGNLKTCKDGDYVRQVKDLSSVADHPGQATAYRQPVYRSGLRSRHGPFLQLIPPNSEYDYASNPVRVRISDISAATSTLDIYVSVNYPGSNIIKVGGVLPGGLCGLNACYLWGFDYGWGYLTTSAATTAFNWTSGDAVGWYDNAVAPKQAVYTGVAEGMQYLNGASRAVSSAGGISVYVAVRSKHTYTNARNTWFTHGNGGNFAFGNYFDGSNSPKLSCFIAGNQRIATTLCASNSPQIYSVRADNTGVTFSMGDLTETVSNAVAVPTASAVPRIGQYSPDTSNSWYGAGDYYAVIVYNRKLTSNEHAQVLAHLRAVTDIQEYTGLLTVAGYSIWAGTNSPDARFWERMDVERLGYEVRVNAIPGITQSQIRTNILATTGLAAFTAPYVSQSNYRAGRKYAILAGLTNDYTITPGDVPAAMTALKATIASLAAQGHVVIPTTDVDKYTGTSQWRTDADAGNPQIRALGLPVIDFAANTRLGAAGAARNQQLFFAGNVHPNSAGQALMSAEVERVLFRGSGSGAYVGGLLSTGASGDRSGR
jgi:hypothetical protein